MPKTNKVLIVDDEPIVTSTLKTLLSLEGFSDANCFNNPKEALEFLKLEKPDVIISDFVMPEMNGLQFLTEAKKLYPEVSMILLTGYADKENAIKAINDVGLYRYIEKPWDNEDLIITIKNAIERSYLTSELKDKIIELERAKEQLEKYSNSLEEIVAQKTIDLIQANNKLNAIIVNCADGIIVFSPDGVVEDVNPACENMFGLSSNMLVDKKVEELFAVNEDFDFNEVFSTSKDQLIRDIDLINFVNDKRVPIEISFAHILPEEDESHSGKYVGVIRDISAQKEMERLRDDFIATLTHDLRTPLLAAIQTLGFFLDGTIGDLTDKQKMLLDTMKKSNQDMLGLVNALLEVYKYESGKLSVVKTLFNFNKLVEQCFDEVVSLAKNKNINIEKNIDVTSDVDINADRNELRRVIMNLLGNAINYTQEGGNVDLISQVRDNDLQFTVRDNGMGIAKTDIPKMFKRFSQGTSQKRSVSTGLGLYLSKQIVEAHGGKIWLESDKGKGSDFSFLLSESIVIKDKV